MPNPALTIRPFGDDEWPLYREVRLRALHDSPDAYGSLLDLEAGLSDDDWAERLVRGVRSTSELPMIAECEGAPCGLAWVRLDDDAPDTAHLYQMWVAGDQRRQGVGRALVDAAATWARVMGAQQLELDVTCNNEAAIRLYEGAGFVTYGERRPLRPGSTLEAQSMRREL
ncbi:MAG TPA: GNAT family N-acetyltransferase [Gemmatimonadaceae bacterium]|nr:GNAT family N-acetyltransferase [Gemmatimonadaceae bacterium]